MNYLIGSARLVAGYTHIIVRACGCVFVWLMRLPTDHLHCLACHYDVFSPHTDLYALSFRWDCQRHNIQYFLFILSLKLNNTMMEEMNLFSLNEPRLEMQSSLLQLVLHGWHVGSGFLRWSIAPVNERNASPQLKGSVI